MGKLSRLRRANHNKNNLRKELLETLEHAFFLRQQLAENGEPFEFGTCPIHGVHAALNAGEETQVNLFFTGQKWQFGGED